MKRFVLFFSDGRVFVAYADHISDALLLSGRPLSKANQLVRYTKNEQMIQVAAQARCGCVYHAEEGLSCEHDLRRVGIYIND